MESGNEHPTIDNSFTLQTLVNGLEANFKSVHDLQYLPPPTGPYGSSLGPSLKHLQSLSTVVTSIQGLMTCFALRPPQSRVFQTLKERQGRDEKTSEVERQWSEVWLGITGKGDTREFVDGVLEELEVLDREMSIEAEVLTATKTSPRI
jgi:hypothetical protein